MSDQTGSPSRYARTTQGLVASLLVTVPIILVVYLVLRADNGAAEQRTDAVDYLEAVDAASGAGVEVVHPPALPKGWIATSVSFSPTGKMAWGIGVLTAADKFVGVRQDDDSLDDLLTTYVDENPVQGPDVTLDSPLATTWSTWSDSGGDHAYATTLEVDGRKDVVLVYGSAPTADLRTFLESLVLD